MYIQHRQRLCIGQCRRFDWLEVTATTQVAVLRDLIAFEERAVQRDVTRLRVLPRGNAQQRPPDVHRTAVERIVQYDWVRQRARADLKAAADRRDKTQPINEFGVAVFLFANTVCDDVGFAGNPNSGGFAFLMLVWLHVSYINELSKATRITAVLTSFHRTITE
jgi:predicted Fe-S protein YdhL (DUF1289 family)